MHRVLLGGRLAAAALLLLLPALGLRADDKAKAGAHAPPKYKVTVHKDGHEEEVIFDLSRPGHDEKLTVLLKDGHVEKVEVDKPVNILAISWDLGLYSIIVFVLLLLILKKVAWGPMLEGLNRREKTIRSALDEAQKAREDARQLREHYDAEMKKAAAEARGIMDEARKDAQRLMEEERARLKTDIQTERDRLYRELNSAKDQALQEMWQQSVQLATLISSKALHREVNADDHRALLDEAMGEMDKAVTDRRAFTGSKA